MVSSSSSWFDYEAYAHAPHPRSPPNPPPPLEAAVEGDEVLLHTGVDCSAYEPS